MDKKASDSFGCNLFCDPLTVMSKATQLKKAFNSFQNIFLS